MRTTRLFVLIAACFAVGAFVGGVGALRAQTRPAVALAGVVSSAAEGPMEGVLVTAKRPGSTIAITVVSDSQGRYRFPAATLRPGRYALAIRAIGYDLVSPGSAVVAHEPATANLRLRPTKDLAGQLTNAEWIASMPGPDEQKRTLLDCVDCHTLQRVVTSTHTADDFLKNVLPRMENYANMSFWLRPQPYPHARSGRGGFVNAEFAAYLASINLSRGPKRTYALKPFPRLKGRSTHVIITEYDLPRREIEPHDVIVGKDGNVWYSDFGEQELGEMSPTTGKVTEYPVPELKKGYLTGSLELEQDPTGDLWLAMMYQGGVARFNPATRTFKEWAVKPDAHPEFTQESMVQPTRMNVDGRVWTNNQDPHVLLALDPATGQFTSYGPVTYEDGGKKLDFRSYGIAPDLQNDVWLFDFAHSAIGKIDKTTGQATVIETPSKHSRPRRGRIDAQGRFWFAEYGANAIGEIDTKGPLETSAIKEYPMPVPYQAPYDVIFDKNGEIWTGSMLTDRIVRLDPKTGASVQYELPTETNIRRVFVDDRTTPVTFWVGSNHGAAIVKLQPTD